MTAFRKQESCESPTGLTWLRDSSERCATALSPPAGKDPGANQAQLHGHVTPGSQL